MSDSPSRAPSGETRETCYYCSLTHRRVEARGVYHCPNLLCTGCGSAIWKRNVPSYREESSMGYTVDSGEMRAFGLAYASAITDDPALVAAIQNSAARWTPTTPEHAPNGHD